MAAVMAQPRSDGDEPYLNGIIALHSVCLTLVTLVVIMRLYTRCWIMKARLAVDDYLCILSYLLTIAFSGLMIKLYTEGFGGYVWGSPNEELLGMLKYFTIAQYIYLILTPIVKLSFLFFYYHIFSKQTMTKSRHLVTLGIVFVICSGIALFLTTLFYCKPIGRAWNPMLPGHCLNSTVLTWIAGTISCITDIYVLVLPIRSFWGLNMPLDRKIRLLAVFSLGILACVASIVRLAMTPALESANGVKWNISKIATWAVIEANVGIFCACLLLLPAFIKRHPPKAIPSYFRRAWSHTANWRSTSTTRSTVDDAPKQYNISWSSDKRSDENHSDHRGYIELTTTDAPQSQKPHSVV